ncbi:MAG: glutamine-hydrolyzing GMP synthase, partial [Gammaproteobacteria bacterium]|nr:glutamine-hydrolyzing GMP synthase [Gammaproteobacteria bacterium]
MDKILILDFGSQYTQLIARRVREMHVYSELHAYDMTEAEIKAFNPQGIILSGGPNSVYESDTPIAPQIVFELGIPVLGICYGMQIMATQLGGRVENAASREFGYAEIRAHNHSPLLDGIQDKTNEEGHGLLDVWMSHGDKVTTLPQEFKVIASNASTPIAGMMHEAKNFYGVQFHPEVTHTKQGFAILKQFVTKICHCKPSWTMPNYIETAVKHIQDQVQDNEVILGLSGGVDSSVAAALIHRAIGSQLTCVFVDNGLLRLNEAEQVMKTFH